MPCLAAFSALLYVQKKPNTILDPECLELLYYKAHNIRYPSSDGCYCACVYVRRGWNNKLLTTSVCVHLISLLCIVFPIKVFMIVTYSITEVRVR